jgi:hypothetical protein
MLTKVLYKRTILSTLLVLVFLAVSFVPAKATWIIVEANPINIPNLSYVDWISRYASGLNSNANAALDWVGRHTPVAGSAFTDTGPDWVERHAPKGSSAPETMKLPYFPSNYYSR